MKAGYDVKFRVGTAKNTKDGSILHTPDVKQIALKFEDNMWRLPMWSKPVRQQSQTGTCRFPLHVSKFSEVVGQTNVDFVTASATLDAYHGFCGSPPSKPKPATHSQSASASLPPGLTLFCGHARHASAPAASWYVLSAHGVHAVAAAPENDPGAHAHTYMEHT